MKEVKEKVISFLSGFFRTDSLKEDDDIFALGFVNSLFAMQLILFIEKEFGIAIGDEDLEIENFNTVNALTSLVERKRASTVSEKTSEQSQFTAEAQRPRREHREVIKEHAN